MNDLLNLAVDAHGGLDRWNRVDTVALELSMGGVIWAQKGQAGIFSSTRYEADAKRQRATLSHFDAAGSKIRFTPDRLSLEDGRGRIVDTRDNPRAAFAGHVNETPWDLFHAAYFESYAIWTYMTQPFLYTYPGFEVEEIEPWREEGQTLRRLKVIFPQGIATHCREQVSYFGPDGLLRRHDYDVDVLGGATGANYADDYRDHDGIMIPHRRRIYGRNPGGQKIPSPLLVSIDIGKVRFGSAPSPDGVVR